MRQENQVNWKTLSFTVLSIYSVKSYISASQCRLHSNATHGAYANSMRQLKMGESYKKDDNYSIRNDYKGGRRMAEVQSGLSLASRRAASSRDFL